MKSKVIMGIVLTLLFIGMLTLEFNVQPVKASGTIYINADGSIDPPTANITTVDNVTYTFNGSINNEIVIERDNIVLDGAGYTLQGTGSGTGINMTGRSNVTIKKMKIKSFWCGIYLFHSSNNNMYGNNITNSTTGISVKESSNNTISGNNIANNNLVGVYLDWSSNNTISGNNMTNNGNGSIISSSSNNTISGNNIANNNYDGVNLTMCDDNTISGNIISNNAKGISIGLSSNNKIFHNNINNNTIQANVTSGYVNTWDDDYPSGGNYWSNYTDVDLYSGPHRNETGSDGIWDHPYVLDTNNTDRYPFTHSDMQVIIHYTQSHISEGSHSYNDTDPVFGTRLYSGESNVSGSPPDANGVRNMTVPLGSGYSNPVYNSTSNTTIHTVSVSDWYGKMYTVNGTGDVDIKSMTNDTGTFFKNWTDGTWHSAGEEWLGDGTPDPAGSAWFTGVLNISIYHGNGTDGLLVGSWLEQIWLTTGSSENTIDEPNSRLNGSYVNATGVPFASPYVGTVGTWVYTRAKLNIPYWQGEHLDSQSKTDQLIAKPPAFIATLFSPANLYVTDPMNRHVGAHPTTGEHVNEISGAYYSGPGSHPQRIVIPNPVDGVYDIKIVGTSTGEYTLVVELATVEKTTAHSYTGNISVGETLESQATVSEGEMTVTSPSTPAVGGIYIPVNKLELLAPYIGLTMLLTVAVITVGYVRKRKRDTGINS